MIYTVNESNIHFLFIILFWRSQTFIAFGKLEILHFFFKKHSNRQHLMSILIISARLGQSLHALILMRQAQVLTHQPSHKPESVMLGMMYLRHGPLLQEPHQSKNPEIILSSCMKLLTPFRICTTLSSMKDLLTALDFRSRSMYDLGTYIMFTTEFGTLLEFWNWMDIGVTGPEISRRDGETRSEKMKTLFSSPAILILLVSWGTMRFISI